MKRIEVREMLFGFLLHAEAIRLDDGWDVSVTGGSRTHVGAVSLAQPGQELRTLLRAGHRDDVISERWAKRLADVWNEPVCVRAGIHYDGVTKTEINLILEAAERLLDRLIQETKEERL